MHCGVSALYILPLNNLNRYYKEHILNPYKQDQLDIHDFGNNLSHKLHQYKQLVIRNPNHLSKLLRCKYHWSKSDPKILVLCGIQHIWTIIWTWKQMTLHLLQGKRSEFLNILIRIACLHTSFQFHNFSRVFLSSILLQHRLHWGKSNVLYRVLQNIAHPLDFPMHSAKTKICSQVWFLPQT